MEAHQEARNKYPQRGRWNKVNAGVGAASAYEREGDKEIVNDSNIRVVDDRIFGESSPHINSLNRNKT